MLRKIGTIIVIMALFFTGCTLNNNKKNNVNKINAPRELSKDTVLIALDNANITFYSNISVASGFEFDLVSTKKIDTLSAKIDIKTPYKIGFSEKKIKDMPEYVYKNYQNMDWKKLYKLETAANRKVLDDINSKELKDYDHYNNQYDDLYNKFIKDNKDKKFYYYSVGINFDYKSNKNIKDEEFSNLKLYIGDKEYNFNIGKIKIEYSTKYNNFSDYLSTDCASVTGKIVFPSNSGYIKISNDYQYTCNKDLKIKKISVLNKDVDVKEVSLDIQNGDSSINKKVKKNEIIELKKGTVISPIIILNDNNMKNKQLYSTIVYGKIDYEVDGKSYSSIFETGYIIQPDVYELIAIKNDKVNFMSYYNDYFNLRKEDD